MTQSPSPKTGSHVWRHVYAGTSLALTILLGTFAGVWMDQHWGWGPWGTLAGAALGLGAGFYNFIREFTGDSSDSGKGA